jgi:hypothetical protein
VQCAKAIREEETLRIYEFRWPLEYLMEWQLIERDEATIRALPPGCDVSIGRESTGLALPPTSEPGG